MIQGLAQLCKTQNDLFSTAKTVLIQENSYQHSDFLTLGWLLSALAKEKKVTFIAFRENYAHFLALSKRVGKSIEGYLKSKQLTYIECFQSHYCSELPLLQTQPQTYVPPPSLIRKIYTKDLSTHADIFKEGQVIVVDAVGYIEDRVDLVFWLYEQSILNDCYLVLGGCSDEGDVTAVLEEEAELVLRLQSDVGGYGKVSVIGGGDRRSVLWKVVNSKVEFSLQISI